MYVYKELTWPISYPLLPIVPKDLPQPPGTSRGHARHRAANLYILSRGRLAHPFSCCIFLLVLYAFEGLWQHILKVDSVRRNIKVNADKRTTWLEGGFDAIQQMTYGVQCITFIFEPLEDFSNHFCNVRVRCSIAWYHGDSLEQDIRMRVE